MYSPEYNTLVPAPASETQTQNPSMFGWTVARGFSIVKSVPRWLRPKTVPQAVVVPPRGTAYEALVAPVEVAWGMGERWRKEGAELRSDARRWADTAWGSGQPDPLSHVPPARAGHAPAHAPSHWQYQDGGGSSTSSAGAKRRKALALRTPRPRAGDGGGRVRRGGEEEAHLERLRAWLDSHRHLPPPLPPAAHLRANQGNLGEQEWMALFARGRGMMSGPSHQDPSQDQFPRLRPSHAPDRDPPPSSESESLAVPGQLEEPESGPRASEAMRLPVQSTPRPPAVAEDDNLNLKEEEEEGKAEEGRGERSGPGPGAAEEEHHDEEEHEAEEEEAGQHRRGRIQFV